MTPGTVHSAKRRRGERDKVPHHQHTPVPRVPLSLGGCGWPSLAFRFGKEGSELKISQGGTASASVAETSLPAEASGSPSPKAGAGCCFPTKASRTGIQPLLATERGWGSPCRHGMGPGVPHTPSASGFPGLRWGFSHELLLALYGR